MSLKLYTVQMLAAEYPFSAEALYRQISLGKLRCRRRGRRIYITPEDFEAWLNPEQTPQAPVADKTACGCHYEHEPVEEHAIRHLVQIGLLLALCGLLLTAAVRPAHAAETDPPKANSIVSGGLTGEQVHQ